MYRFTRVPFGIICSLFLLSGSIQHHLNNIDRKPALKLSKELYVDNVISREATPQQAINLRQITKETFQEYINELLGMGDELN